MLRGDYASATDMNEHLVEFTVPMVEPKPPHYFVSLISDRWMHSESRITLSFRQLILPEKFPPHTQLLDLQPLSVSSLEEPEYKTLYSDFANFNKVQTQTFNSLFSTDDNVFIGASTGSGKTVCAEFAILRHFRSRTLGRAIYVAPFQELVDQRHADWSKRLSHLGGGKNIVKLTGDITTDLKILDQGDLVLSTPLQCTCSNESYKTRILMQLSRGPLVTTMATAQKCPNSKGFHCG